MPSFPVELVAPDGRVATATSPREYNDLVYGGGYKEKGADKPKMQTPAKAPKAEGSP